MAVNRSNDKPIVITANLIEHRLREKHCGDIFVSQCKTGGSWSGMYQILDAWAMNKSWAHPLTIGYEIKVDRQDFLNDEKWMGYLPYCNEFYFVTPSKLVMPEEIPDEIGLLWLSTTGNRFYKKKKAVHRTADKIESLYKYILMTRTKICTSYESFTTVEDKYEYWKAWLAKEDEKKVLGHNISRKIRQLVEENIDRVARVNSNLVDQNKDLEEIKKLIEELGFDRKGYFWAGAVERQIRNLGSLVPKNVEDEIRRLAKSLKDLTEILDEAKKGKIK